MLTIVGNIYQSLTERCSMHRIGPDLHIKNSLASPMVVAFVPSSYYTLQFSVVFKEATLVSASVMLNPDTHIFISGHLALSPPHYSPRIEVTSGDWILHNGGLNQDVADEFSKARVYGTVYVTGICWDFENKWESYVNVVDCSVGKVSFFLLVMFFTICSCGSSRSELWFFDGIKMTSDGQNQALYNASQYPKTTWNATMW